ncbi:MAG TPA: YCF48-related protein [Candidatus Eisenbacteria bacterium]|nr:YCF48-related protein [Candidatus Eisenbacteria bacterium]
MNPELPKPILDALGKGPTPAEHPAAELLAAFAERALAGEEERQVTEHLARCGDCREIVFLASSAAQEPMQQERELVAAAAVMIPQTATKAAQRWRLRLAWAAPVAAAVLVAAGVVVWQESQREPAGLKVASNVESQGGERPAATAPEVKAPPLAKSVAVLSAPKPEAKSKPAKHAQPEAPETVAVGASALPEIQAGGVPSVSGAQSARNEPAKIAIGGPVAPAAAPAAQGSAFAGGEAGAIGYTPSAADQLRFSRAAPVAGAGSPGWRVTPEGHLERSTADGWTRVLANEAAAFRVVAVIGENVWAGGKGGALFHSGDGGQEWKAVALNTPSGGETGTIVAIRFADPQHGLVVTDDGKRWTTSDGGTTWTSP